MTRRVNLKPDRNPYAVDEPPSDFATETRQLEDPKLARPLIRRKSQKPRTKRNKHEEDDLAMAVATLFARILPETVWWHHNPNGGRRDEREGARFKSMGVKAGVLDYTLYWVAADGLREVGHIELKIGKNTTSEAQDAFIERVSKLGHYVGVCRSTVEVVTKLIDWRVPHKRVS